VTAKRRVTAAGVAWVCLGLVACSPSHPAKAPADTPDRTGRTAHDSLTPLRPSVPAGPSTCGGYAISATTRSGTIPLLSCAGLAGLSPLPSVAIGIGEDVTVAGLGKHQRLTAAPSNLTRLEGTTLIALKAGSSVVTAHGVLCMPSPGGAPPNSCGLLVIVAK